MKLTINKFNTLRCIYWTKLLLEYQSSVRDNNRTLRIRSYDVEWCASSIFQIIFYGNTVNLVGLIVVDSASVSRINLTDAQLWQYREKEKGRTYKGKGGRSGASHEQERRSHVAHFRNTLAAQSQPEGTWSVERMALSDVGVAWKRGKERKRPAGAISPCPQRISITTFISITLAENFSLLRVSNYHCNKKKINVKRNNYWNDSQKLFWFFESLRLIIFTLFNKLQKNAKENEFLFDEIVHLILLF